MSGSPVHGDLQNVLKRVLFSGANSELEKAEGNSFVNSKMKKK
jgi:hypothetical protein